MSGALPHASMPAAAGRVVVMHRHTRRGLAVSGAFAIAALVAALVPHDTGAWLPLHLFFAGSLATAISTVTLMLAVTWSAAPAPSEPLMSMQRWMLAAGALAVAAGREGDSRLLTGVGGGAVVAALALVGALLVTIRRRGSTDRYLPAIDAYLLALTAAVGGVALGIWIGAVRLSAQLREAHLLANLLAFVGVVIAGTVPYFVATQARVKMSPWATPRRIRAATSTMWAAAVASAVAAAGGHRDLVAIALVVYAAGIVAIGALLPRPTGKSLTWAGPRLTQLLLGLAWWAAMVVHAATTWGRTGIEHATLLALVVGGFGQILAASFAYLVPVVRGGGHEALTAGFRRTRSWVGLLLANAAAVLALAGQERAMLAMVGLWIADAAARSAIVGGCRSLRERRD